MGAGFVFSQSYGVLGVYTANWYFEVPATHWPPCALQEVCSLGRWQCRLEPLLAQWPVFLLPDSCFEAVSWHVHNGTVCVAVCGCVCVCGCVLRAVCLLAMAVCASAKRGSQGDGGVCVGLAGRYPVLEAIDTALQQQGLRVMVLLRFSPLVPYNVFNYVAGATAVSLKDYTLGCVGMIPGVIAFVYFGTLFTSATAAASSQGSIPAWAKWTLLSVGAVASVAAIYFVTAYSRRELRRLVLQQRSPGGALMVDARDRNRRSDGPRV